MATSLQAATGKVRMTELVKARSLFFFLSLCVFCCLVYSFNKNLQGNFLIVELLSQRYRSLDSCQVPRGYIN